MRPSQPILRPSTAHIVRPPAQYRPVEYSSPCGRIQIVNGDAFAVLSNLPDASLDALVTDPPYCSGSATLTGIQADPSKKYTQGGQKWVWPSFDNDCKSPHAWRLWLMTMLGEARRALKDGAYVLMSSDWRRVSDAQAVIEGAGYIFRGIVPWDKGLGSRAPHTGYFRHQCEYVLWGTKGPCLKRAGGPFPGVFTHPNERPGVKQHVTGKPIALMTDLLRPLPEGCLILDPFAGSASTGVAALKTGRRFLGVEITPHYFKTACDRLKATLADLGTGAA